MKTQIDLSAVENQNLESFIEKVYSYLRNIKENKLKKELIFYSKDEFKNLNWNDKAVDRIVARYKDIMLCLDVYNKYDEKAIVQNMKIFAKVIRMVASKFSLDRVIYVRIFKKGTINKEKGIVISKGYCDKYREFNEDILDLITISLEDLKRLNMNLGDTLK